MSEACENERGVGADAGTRPVGHREGHRGSEHRRVAACEAQEEVASRDPATAVCKDMTLKVGRFTLGVRRGARALLIGVLVVGCGGRQGALPTASRAEVTSTKADQLQGGASAQPPETRRPFSGEIVYRRTAVPNGSSDAPRDLGEFHYFISGSHWKHVDASGDTTALYDPERNLVHYFKPERKTVDAAQAATPDVFELLNETKLVLGRACKGVRQISADRRYTIFYDPSLFVDPHQYPNHHLGSWTELLAVTGGGLSLFSKTETDRGDLVSEAVRIEARSFDDSFWHIPDDGSGSPPIPHDGT